MSKIEELRVVANSETATADEKAVAAKLLADLEKPETLAEMLEQVYARIDAKAEAYRADQIARFKVCSSCLLRQAKDSPTCELCGAMKWESPLPASIERERFIAATTDYTDEQLNYHVERDSINTAFAKHCAKVLELRGVPRLMSFWERGGFTFDGQPRA